MKDSRCSYLLLLCPLVGCVELAEASEPWMAPPEVLGKADAIATLSGVDIPSGYVDEDVTYLHDRSIAALHDVGAIADASHSLAVRADGIIDALPADGRLDVEELVRMEQSPYFDSLYPEEQEALGVLWPLLEVPDSPPVAFTFEALEALEVDDRTVEPTGLDYPASFEVFDFPNSMHDAIRRGQLLYDADGDDATVAFEDLEEALANPGTFTLGEIRLIELARDWYHDKAISALSARVAVTSPEVGGDDVVLGDMVLRRDWEVSVQETRERRTYEVQPLHAFVVDVNLVREVTIAPDLSAAQQWLIIDTASEGDTVLDNGSFSAPAGSYLVELWDDGTRVAAMWADLPALGVAEESLELSDYWGHVFETLDGVELHRNLRSTETLNRTGPAGDRYRPSQAAYTWDLEPEDDPADVSTRIVRDTTFVETDLRPGRYSFPDFEDTFFDVFPEGALRLHHEGETSWLRPGRVRERYQETSRHPRLVLGDTTVAFHPDREDLRLPTGLGHTVRVRVDGRNRVQ